jgi:ABC-type sulfate transport system substrate-binding protein
MKTLFLLLSALATPLWMASVAEPVKLLNVSCDVALPFYKDFNRGWAKAQQVHFNDGGTFDQIHAQ